MILQKIDIDSDLGVGSVEGALANLYDQEDLSLFVNTGDIDIGMKVAKELKLKLYVDDKLGSDEWYVKSKYFGMFSPGA